MAKQILGIIFGYLAFFCGTYALMTGLWFALGTERVFQPNTFQITMLWIVVILLVAVIAGAVGGLVCSAISKSAGAVKILAVVVFVLAVLMCLRVMMADQAPKSRPADLQMTAAMQQAQAPIWVHLVSSALGGLGVLAGRRTRLS